MSVLTDFQEALLNGEYELAEAILPHALRQTRNGINGVNKACWVIHEQLQGPLSTLPLGYDVIEIELAAQIAIWALKHLVPLCSPVKSTEVMTDWEPWIEAVKRQTIRAARA